MTTQSRARCPWKWGTKRCPNQCSSIDAAMCGNHHHLQQQLDAFIRMRAYIVSARKLLREAQATDRDTVYSAYVPGCKHWESEVSRVADQLEANIEAMDAAWLKARSGLELKAFKKVFED